MDGDDETVLQHILSCDVERCALLKKMEEIVHENESKNTKQEKNSNRSSLNVYQKSASVLNKSIQMVLKQRPSKL